MTAIGGAGHVEDGGYLEGSRSGHYVVCGQVRARYGQSGGWELVRQQAFALSV